MGPGALARVLRPLTLLAHPDLLVGLRTSDDAAVFRLAPDLALIQTVDFFPPIVDDAFTFGAIAAANAMSDIYAMGGEVILGLNIAAWPEELPGDVLTRIFDGGAAKLAEVGAVIAGGHTVTDAEPKYGLCVTGRVHPDRVLTKAGAGPGDVLYLTKPIGSGVITTAHKQERVSAEDLAAAVANMVRLNRGAAACAQVARVTACTDITGFGLAGHAAEVAEKSEVRLRISASQVPLLPGAARYAAMGAVPGGLGRNRAHYCGAPNQPVELENGIAPEVEALLFDPQTSGGLLLSVPAAQSAELEAAFADANEQLWQIGAVVEGQGVLITP